MTDPVNALGQPAPNRTDFKSWSREGLEKFARHVADENLVLEANNNVLLEQWRAEVKKNEPAPPLTTDELDLCRQWFNSVQDTNGGYLTPQDYVLAEKLYKQLDMRVPHSISEIAAQGIGAKK